MSTVLVINKDQMGSGEAELGQKILGACLRKLLSAFSDIETIVLFNGGVRLATMDSPVARELTLFHERGVDILVCGTCIDHFGLRAAFLFEQPSNMDEILGAMEAADKVITI